MYITHENCILVTYQSGRIWSTPCYIDNIIVKIKEEEGYDKIVEGVVRRLVSELQTVDFPSERASLT